MIMIMMMMMMMIIIMCQPSSESTNKRPITDEAQRTNSDNKG
jgi:uncharacterized membrane protein YhaH (DUF805 family)